MLGQGLLRKCGDIMDKDLCKEMMLNHDKKIDKLDSRVSSLEKTYSIMEKMDYRMGQVENSVNQINKKIDKYRDDKGFKWDKLIDYLFYALIGYGLIKLGLK